MRKNAATVRPKALVIEALTQAEALARGPEPIGGVRLVQLRGALEYAQQQAALIQEARKLRRLAAPATPIAAIPGAITG